MKKLINILQEIRIKTPIILKIGVKYDIHYTEEEEDEIYDHGWEHNLIYEGESHGKHIFYNMETDIGYNIPFDEMKKLIKKSRIRYSKS